MHNQARENPKTMIEPLEKMLGCFEEKMLRMPGRDYDIETREGVEAVEEAITFLHS